MPKYDHGECGHGVDGVSAIVALDDGAKNTGAECVLCRARFVPESKLHTVEQQRDEWRQYADDGLSSYADLQKEVLSLSSRLHQLSEDHSHCEDLLHELGARVSTAESRLGTLESILSEAFEHLPIGGVGQVRWRAEEYMRERNKEAFAVEKPAQNSGGPT